MFRGAVEGFVVALFWFAMFLFLLIAPALIFGPDIESRYYPVMENIVVERVTYDELSTTVISKYSDDYRWYRIRYDKTRSCEPVPETFAWYTIDQYGDSRRVNISRIGNGETALGPNIMYIFVEQDSMFFTKQRFVVVHKCHTLWPTRTNININIGSS